MCTCGRRECCRKLSGVLLLSWSVVARAPCGVGGRAAARGAGRSPPSRRASTCGRRSRRRRSSHGAHAFQKSSGYVGRRRLTPLRYARLQRPFSGSRYACVEPFRLPLCRHAVQKWSGYMGRRRVSELLPASSVPHFDMHAATKRAVYAVLSAWSFADFPDVAKNISQSVLPSSVK